jgi:fatty acid desaturase (delta-4 desaturase)
MPPNADTSNLRHRNGMTTKDDMLAREGVDDPAAVIVAGTYTTPNGGGGRIDSITNLKGSEVAIEGIIYDLTGFQHPGGNIVHIFGGNDVTVQYKMMHPFHTARHLEKLKPVGRVSDWKPECVFL